MRFYIYTFGCKVNNYESNMMKEKLLHHNFSLAPLEDADIFIINTCTVTNTADQKCLKLVRRLLKKYPDKISVVVGCSTQNNFDKYACLGIDILLGNKDKTKIVEYLEEFLRTRKPITNISPKRSLEFEDMRLNDYDKARAFLKIEDGCDNFCAYCIIPFVRGSVRSKNYAEVLAEAQDLALKHKEIILTGIHTGHYEDSGHDLSDLISDLNVISNLKRIRVSSIEVTELNEKFMDVLRTCNKLVDHLHIPLQAGSDKILKAMNRKYNVAYFKNKIKEIRAIRPDIAITTDIIVGFPGETEKDFLETLKVSKEVGFSKIHVFPFSPRTGTAAAKMTDVVSDVEKKERVKKLMALSIELESAYFNKFKGQEVEVLVEKSEDGKSYGHTSNYLEVEIPEELEVGNIYKRVL